MSHTILIAIFAAAALAPWFCRKEKQVFYCAYAAALIGAGYVLASVSALFSGQISLAYGPLWLTDGFSAMMAALIATLYLTSSLVAVRYIGHEAEEKIIGLRDVKLFFSLLPIFVFCMLSVVFANNTMLLWVALESTTLSSTFLVGFYRKQKSVEAAWKYIIICSTGITLGLIGVLLLAYGMHIAGVANSEIFQLTSLAKHIAQIPTGMVRLSFVFIFIGFGAKVGFAPLHAWLPDAHSKAPSPISALFSGILLNVALYAIIRFEGIINIVPQNGPWSKNFFLVFGLVSIFVPAFILLVQANYKRMLAYSSIEHMGLIALAMAFPPLGVIAALIHMIGHTLVKSALFFSAGEILLNLKTTSVELVTGLLSRLRFTGLLFLAGILSIIAVPPSILFVSEFRLFTSAFMVSPWIALLALLPLSMIAYSMLRTAVAMLLPGRSEAKASYMPERWNMTHSIVSIQLSLAIFIAFYLSSPTGSAMLQNIKDSISLISK